MMKFLAMILFAAFASHAMPAQSRQKSPNPFGNDTAKIRAEAMKLINMPEPVFNSPPTVDTSHAAEIRGEQVYRSESCWFKMRDGKFLHAERFRRKSRTTVILLHGVLGSSRQMNRTAGLLRDALKAEVYALDLRGHGESQGTPGDVDYIGQYENDLEDVVEAVKKQKPGGRIILAGHSMGGGIELCYAMKKNAPAVDGYLLFSPLLGQNSPTIPRVDPDRKAGSGKEPFLKVDIMRIIGLKMLNSIGVHKYDSLPVLFFNLPKGAPLREYTYRSDQSMSPDDYRQGLRAVHKPLLVLVGSRDEAFVASAFRPAVTGNSHGEVVVIKGATHESILYSKAAMDTVVSWASRYDLR